MPGRDLRACIAGAASAIGAGGGGGGGGRPAPFAPFACDGLGDAPGVSGEDGSDMVLARGWDPACGSCICMYADAAAAVPTVDISIVSAFGEHHKSLDRQTK